MSTPTTTTAKVTVENPCSCATPIHIMRCDACGDWCQVHPGYPIEAVTGRVNAKCVYCGHPQVSFTGCGH